MGNKKIYYDKRNDLIVLVYPKNKLSECYCCGTYYKTSSDGFEFYTEKDVEKCFGWIHIGDL